MIFVDQLKICMLAAIFLGLFFCIFFLLFTIENFQCIGKRNSITNSKKPSCIVLLVSGTNNGLSCIHRSPCRCSVNKDAPPEYTSPFSSESHFFPITNLRG